jgi:hypothetical protein
VRYRVPRLPRPRLLLPAVLLALLVPLVVPSAAVANSYPGLNQRDFTHSPDVLRMRVAIEYSPTTGEHWARVRVICLKQSPHGLINQTCGVITQAAGWVDNRNLLGTRSWEDYDQSDVPHVGTPRTPAVNHRYVVRMAAAVVFADGYVSHSHLVCSDEMTYRGNGVYSNGGQWCPDSIG